MDKNNAVALDDLVSSRNRKSGREEIFFPCFPKGQRSLIHSSFNNIIVDESKTKIRIQFR